MMNQEPVFHRFPDLPTELREAVWALCLPHRIYELDEPEPSEVFYIPDDAEPMPCQLHHTSHMNGRPPLISRICHESRSVALKAGSMNGVGHMLASKENRPEDAIWESSTSREDIWLDPARASAHLNYTPSYEPMWASWGSPLGLLVWLASNMTGVASIMLDYIEPTYRYPEDKPQWLTDNLPFRRSRARDIEILESLRYWPIVMRTVVVHTDFKIVAGTGLFGLLGDAPVQIIEVADHARVAAFYAIKENGKADIVSVDHRVDQDPTSTLKRELEEVVMATFKTQGLATKLRPAIMFRLCTKGCNR